MIVAMVVLRTGLRAMVVLVIVVVAVCGRRIAGGQVAGRRRLRTRSVQLVDW